MVDNISIIDITKPCLQKEFALLVGLSEFAVSDMISRGIIKSGDPLGQWLKAYCFRIREEAAGRATNGEICLATERALLSREQKLRIEMQNAITRKEYAPIAALERGLTDALARVASQLDTIPGKLKMNSDKLTANDLDEVTEIINSVRNELADLDLDWFDDKIAEEDFNDDKTLDSSS